LEQDLLPKKLLQISDKFSEIEEIDFPKICPAAPYPKG